MAFSQPSPSSSLTSRESFLEKKISILDKRLTNVEKFIELRFRATETIISSCNLIDNEDKPKSRSREKESKKNIDDVAFIKFFNAESPENLASTSTRSHPESSKSVEEISTSNTPTTGHTKKRKKNRPGPASVKQKREEKAAAERAFQDEKLKDCVVLITKAKIPAPVTRAVDHDKVEIMKTSSGRARKIPKRFEEEDYEDFGTSKRSKRCTKGRKLEEESIKKETEQHNEMEVEKPKGSETPVAIIFDHGEDGVSEYDDGQGDHDTFIDVDDPSLPPEGGNEEECGGEDEEVNYFTFLKSPPRDTPVTVVGQQRKEDDDEDWDAESEHAENDEDDERETPEEKPSVKRGRGRPRTRNSSGRFQKIKKIKPKKEPVEDTPKKVRKFVSVPLLEVPTEMLASADTSVKLCELCKKHIKNELFENHLESHAKERHLKCTQCDKAYFNTYMLKKHMRVHEPEKYAKKCRLCEKQFIQMDKLLSHERYCVKRALENHQFVDPNVIEDLKKRSKGHPSWIAEVEGMEEDAASTTSGNKLDSSSSGRKQCPHCNKNFKADFFEKHLRVHNKEKTWSCNKCDKSYHYKHDLVRHVTLEHVADPRCEFCGENFKDRKLLKEHRTPCRRMYKKERLSIQKVTSLVKIENNDEEKDEKVVQDEDVVQNKEVLQDEEVVQEEEVDYNNCSTQEGTNVMQVEVGDTIVGGPIVIEEVSIIDGGYEVEEGTHQITLGLVTAGD